ncbi:VWA domain-containing protein [Myxococcota bacterium]|nr:VWA domain-containing protein [Myxococcota bacterium]MBU1380149.1 VWA domain-containing protein [Myxococcota bacterium]MBU1495646.1 VWA domain-containing protein [Myxococcota bacterium]
MKLLSFVLLAVISVVPISAKAQDSCSVPKVLIVLDKSSSMTRTLDGHTLWYWAQQAVTTLVNAYDGRIDFGLMIYPGTNHCSTGQVQVDVGPGNAADIIAATTAAPPTAGNYTPTYQSLDALVSYNPIMDPTSANYVILITDGWQWCDPYDASTRFNAVDSIADLRGLGIKTAAIGFHNTVDATALHRMAVEGDMERSGCDPTASLIGASNRCYYQTDDGAQLQQVLDSIGAVITAEVCDGVDNNCDGQIDEGLYQACSTICGNGVEECVDGQWVNCSAQEPETERCDDIDNNCDGTIDEGCTCLDGESRACGMTTGACSTGLQFCENGTWTECRDAVWPVEEECNGVDDDCDGFIDENLVESCSSVCGNGTSVCVNGNWTDCSAPQPSTETCNGHDDDCDGVVDNGTNLCPEGFDCIEGTCVDTNGNLPDGGTDIGENTGTSSDPDGCKCSAGTTGSSSNGILWLGFIIGAALMFSRKRFF